MRYEQPFANPDPNAPYINADPPKGIHGSIPGGPAVENPMREIENIIKNAQQIPTDDDLMQVTRSVRDGRLNFCIDQGTANQLAISQLSPPITTYEAGLELRVLVANSVIDGGTTIAVGDLAPAAVVKLDGTALKAKDLLAGQIADLVCDGVAFQVQNLGIADQAGNGNVDRFEAYIPYVHDTGTTNILIGLYVPPLPNINEGRTCEIKLANNTTGPVTFKPNNFPAYPVAHPDGSPMSAGDGVINQIWLLAFDGGVWQLISSRADPNALIVRRPKRSLQFQDPNAGWWGSYTSFPFFKRQATVAGNSNVWTFSTFIRWPVSIPRPNVYPGNQTDLREFIVSAGDATPVDPAGGQGGLGDVTCLEFEGGDIDTCLSTFWANTLVPKTGYGDATVPATHNGIFKWGVFKDQNWHHLLWRADALGAHQEEVWIDGILVNAAPVTTPSTMNAARLHAIGTETGPDEVTSVIPLQPSSYGCRARMAEIVMVDGLWLDWDFFAYNIGGIMIPKEMNIGAMNFGVNGYYLNFTDGSGTTSTSLGKDFSPNANNWTPVNFTTARLHLDYPGNPDSTETFSTFDNGGAWPTGLPPGWRSAAGP